MAGSISSSHTERSSGWHEKEGKKDGFYLAAAVRFKDKFLTSFM